MPLVVRAILWVLLVVAPGGVLLLPFLIRDARRRAASIPDGTTDSPVTGAIKAAH